MKKGGNFSSFFLSYIFAFARKFGKSAALLLQTLIFTIFQFNKPLNRCEFSRDNGTGVVESVK